MKTIISTLLFFLFLTGSVYSKKVNFTLTNKTGQMISNLEYWLGSANESNSAGLNYNSKASVAANGTISIPMKFHKKKRNTVLIKAYLKGGGYVKQKYTISIGQDDPKMELFNNCEKIPTDEYKKVIAKFTELKLDKGYVKISQENGLNSLIGSIIIYDENEKVISKIDPKILKRPFHP